MATFFRKPLGMERAADTMEGLLSVHRRRSSRKLAPLATVLAVIALTLGSARTICHRKIGLGISSITVITSSPSRAALPRLTVKNHRRCQNPRRYGAPPPTTRKHTAMAASDGAQENAQEKAAAAPVKLETGKGPAFDPGTPWQIPSFQASKRTFQCFGYDEAYTGKAPAISCDGLVQGASLHLSHWNNNKTPDQLYSDLSTEIALRFIKTPASRQDKWNTAVVVNNHFDTDGVCSAYATLKPDLGWKHRRILVDAAAVGDFDEWPRMNEDALKLHASIEAIGAAGESDADKYRLVLERMDNLLENLNSYEDLWGPYMKEIEQGQKNLEVLLSEPYRVYEDNGIAVVLMTQGMDDIPGPVLHKQFGFSNDRFLLAKQQEADTDKYTYKYVMNGHGWAPTKQRPNLKKPYVERLISKLDKSTGGVKWAKAPGLTGLVESKGVVDMDHEDVVDIFATT
eukprot:jgi/Bigna1/75729/fgenesh1_pg.36_\